jgi:DNA-binding CsgD family transcriptional regulator
MTESGQTGKKNRAGQTHLIAKALNRLTGYLGTAEGPADPAGPPGAQTVAYSQKSGLSPEFIERYGLSGRQADVIEVLLRGKSDKEIAAFLDIAPSTVQTHLKNVYRKTGAQGRFALMALVGLVREQGTGNGEKRNEE